MRLIEKVWFQKHQAKWILVPLLLPFTLLFWIVTKIRRLSYRAGILQSIKVDKPVMVVGNIGVGGNGKTPVVILLVNLCKSLGLKPGVISRGYGGNAPHYPYKLNNTSTADVAGDEPFLIYNRCQVPVVVGADRIASCQQLIEDGCDIIIADDGLQHYRLVRNSEIIVVDEKRRFGNELLLPAGPLREGIWRISTANLLISNIAKGQNSSNTNEAFSDDENGMRMHLTPQCFVNLSTNERIDVREFLRQFPRVQAIAGIGDPKRFFNTLVNEGLTLEIEQGFVDHHHFSANDFKYYNEELPVVMTEKDAVKCYSFAKSNWWYLTVDAEFSESDKSQIIAEIKRISA